MSDETAESNPVILCLDTAYGGLSVGLLAADGQAYASFEDTQYDQASHIVTAIDELLSTASTDKADLDAILVTIGPGSFTGVRLALSVAKALALALNIRVLPVSCFDVLAWQALKEKQLSGSFGTIIKNKPESYYVQFFDENAEPVTAPVCCSQNDLKNQCNIMNIKDLIGRGDIADVAIQYLDGAAMAQYAKKIFTYEKMRYDAIPLYLREADISFSKKKQRKLL